MSERIIEACKGKNVYIYGDGEVGRLTRVFLHEQGIDAKAFAVTIEPSRSRLMDIPVVKLSDVVCDQNDFFIICMHKKWWDSAVERLSLISKAPYIIIDEKIRRDIVSRVQFRDIFDDVEKGRFINTLLYHRVEEIDTVSSLVVGRRNFEDQLRFIKSNYNVLRADESWEGVDKKSVVLTFDDGYRDFYWNAYPLLKKYCIPATVFVSTGNIDTTHEFWWDRLERIIIGTNAPESFFVLGEKYITAKYNNREELLDEIHDQIIIYHFEDREKAVDELASQFKITATERELYRTMSSEEIIELSKDPLITIGAHTVSHILCDCESADTQRKEILDSKQRLEGITGKEVRLFAYPNGNIGHETRTILEELGFERAFTCVNGCIGHDDKKYDIPRCPVLDWPADQNERRFRGMWQTGKDV